MRSIYAYIFENICVSLCFHMNSRMRALCIAGAACAIAVTTIPLPVCFTPKGCTFNGHALADVCFPGERRRNRKEAVLRAERCDEWIKAQPGSVLPEEPYDPRKARFDWLMKNRHRRRLLQAYIDSGCDDIEVPTPCYREGVDPLCPPLPRSNWFPDGSHPD